MTQKINIALDEANPMASEINSSNPQTMAEHRYCLLGDRDYDPKDDELDDSLPQSKFVGQCSENVENQYLASLDK